MILGIVSGMGLMENELQGTLEGPVWSAVLGLECGLLPLCGTRCFAEDF